MDQKTRDLMSMCKALHTKYVIDHLYQEKKVKEDSISRVSSFIYLFIYFQL